jgi:RNA polymerase sigma factor (TIGR02999 family)
MAQEKPDQTLQATALVHEAYIRLVDTEKAWHWSSRGHFFGAAAEAMRRILVESARHKACLQHGGEYRRIPLDDGWQVTSSPPDELLDLDDALCRLETSDPVTAHLVKLRCFAGVTMRQAADALGVSLRNAERHWTYARTWLHRELSQGDHRARGDSGAPPKI